VSVPVSQTACSGECPVGAVRLSLARNILPEPGPGRREQPHYHQKPSDVNGAEPKFTAAGGHDVEIFQGK
jgi:hypothetical protein